MRPYARATPRPKPQVRLADRTETAAHATWQRRIKAWQRRDLYRVSSMHLPTETAAEQLGVTVRTIERWRVIIFTGRHVHPGPYRARPRGSGS